MVAHPFENQAYTIQQKPWLRHQSMKQRRLTH